jgi:hypothetical protein
VTRKCISREDEEQRNKMSENKEHCITYFKIGNKMRCCGLVAGTPAA